uniref:Uncharacterized protein n=1 Tax=Setaria viridis TaxID=4556 RepID=A0A4U6UIE6_SETVI|nr:hypothetical protein SEVIR_5G189000v2 [Setaria viridis]
MSRFLRRAASRVLGRPFSGLFLASASPPAAGHVGLVRARPGLGRMLTPEALLLDATHALGAAELRDLPHTGRANRELHDVITPADLARAEARGDAKAATVHRLLIVLLDVEDGLFDDALPALARLAGESYSPRLCYAAICDLIGRTDEADRCLACFPEDQRPRQQISFQMGIVSVTLGGIQVAKVAGSEGRVASAALQIINESVTKMSAFQIIVAAMLKRARGGRGGTWRRSTAMTELECSARSSRSSPAAAAPTPRASQALLSAVVLRAPPLSGERVRARLRATERELARAVRKREDPAAVADLRLLVAFLATRDGRFHDALERYVEMERADPSDPRPHYLAHIVCQFDGRPEESDKWLATYNRLATGSSVDEQAALIALTDELVVALALGGSLLAFDAERYPVEVGKVVGAAASRVDVALVSALRDKKMSMVERLEIKAVRALLHAGVWSLLKKLKSNDGGNGSTTSTE